MPPPSSQLQQNPQQVTTDCCGVTSYLVASSPEVLTQILRDNESRGLEFNPALYTTPASALNTAKVDFAPSSFGPPPPSPAAGGRHRPPGGPSAGRSLPGSAHSTLSRGHSSSSPGSLEMNGGRRAVRRKASFAASGCQVIAACLLLPWCCLSLSLVRAACHASYFPCTHKL